MKPHNTIIVLLAATAVICLTLAGCVGGPQRTAYNTLSSVEIAGSNSLDGFYSWSLAHKSTNGVHQASVMFNELQEAVKLAAATAQAGTNALAPGNVIVELADLNAFIATFKK